MECFLFDSFDQAQVNETLVIKQNVLLLQQKVNFYFDY